MVTYTLEYTAEDIEFGELSTVSIPADTFFLYKVVDSDSSSSEFVASHSVSEYYDIEINVGTSLAFSASFDKKVILGSGYSLFSFYCDHIHNFKISHKASARIIELILLKNASGSSSDSSFFTSLNGKYGSFPDGSIVTVSGKTGDFTVKSSEILWNDDESKLFMLVYILSDSLGCFLMAPDIHVTLKA